MENFVDLYTDYLITSTSYTTATGMAPLLSIKHNEITPTLATWDYDSKFLWKRAKVYIEEVTRSKETVLLSLDDFGRRADTGILKDFFIGECPRAIVRPKKSARVDNGLEKVEVRELAKKIGFPLGQKVIKVKKNRPVTEVYDIVAVPIEYKMGRAVHPYD